MKRNHRLRAMNALKVKFHGLTRKEVHRDGIAAERVDHQNIKIVAFAPGKFFLQTDAPVAFNDVYLGWRRFHEGEVRVVLGRKLSYGRVDFVEAIVIPRLSVRGEAPCPHTDNANAEIRMVG